MSFSEEREALHVFDLKSTSSALIRFVRCSRLVLVQILYACSKNGFISQTLLFFSLSLFSIQNTLY